MRLLCPPVLLATLLAALSARAGDPPPRQEKAADELFQNARAAMEHGDLATACAQFAESQRLDPAPGTLLNLGECEERSGKVASALGHVKEARANLPPGDYRIAFADARIAGLLSRVPRLTLLFADSSVPGVRVTCDGMEIAAASFGKELPADPGDHTCIVRAPGRADARAVASMKEAETRTLALKLGPILGGATAGAAGPAQIDRSEPASADDVGRVQRTVGLVTGGAGVLGVGIGTVFGILAKSSYNSALATYCKSGPSSCTQDGVNGGQTAQDQARTSTIAFLVGGVLLAGGAVLYLTAPKGESVAVAPAVGSNGGGLSVSGVW